MVKDDYILKPLFLLIDEVISKFTVIKFERIKDKEQYTNSLYSNFVKKNAKYFIEKDINDFFNDGFITHDKLSLIAKMFYLDSLVQIDESIKVVLLKKTEKILKYISKENNTYSIERENWIISVNKEIIRFEK